MDNQVYQEITDNSLIISYPIILQFTTKQLERLASKAEKDQKKEQNKVKKVSIS